jgi:hypothetical protein
MNIEREVRAVGMVGGSILEFPGGFPGLESKRRCPVFGETTIDKFSVFTIILPCF